MGMIGSVKAHNFFVCKIQARIDNLRDTVNDVLEYYTKMYGEMSDSAYTELKVVLNELLINAIKHGSKEDGGKYVKVVAGLADGERALVVVEDDGEGYDAARVQTGAGRRKPKAKAKDFVAAAEGAECALSACAGAAAGAAAGANAGLSAGGPAVAADPGASAVAAADPILSIPETGRGINIVRNLCDDFCVNEKGNKVTVNKRLSKRG